MIFRRMSKYIFPFVEKGIHRTNKGMKKKEFINLMILTSISKDMKLKELENDETIERLVKISKKMTEIFLNEI